MIVGVLRVGAENSTTRRMLIAFSASRIACAIEKHCAPLSLAARATSAASPSVPSAMAVPVQWNTTGLQLASPSADAARPTSSSKLRDRLLVTAGHLDARHVNADARGRVAMKLRFRHPVRGRDDQADARLRFQRVTARDDGVFQRAHHALSWLESEQPHGVAAEDRLLRIARTGTAGPRSSPARRSCAPGNWSPTPAASRH